MTHIGGGQLELDGRIRGKHQHRHFLGGAQGFNLIEVQVGHIRLGPAIDRVLAVGVNLAFLGKFLPLLVGAHVFLAVGGEFRGNLLVAELPVPLISGHVHGHLGIFVQCGDFFLSLDGEEEQAHHNDDREDGQHQFQGNIILGLAGEFVFAGFLGSLGGPGEHAIDKQAPHDKADGPGDYPHPFPKVVHGCCFGGNAFGPAHSQEPPQCSTRSIDITTGQHQAAKPEQAT